MSQKYADSKAFTPNSAHIEQRSFLELPYDVGIEDILRPDFWRPIAGQISKHAIVTAVGGRGDIDVDLRCIDSGNGYCIMRIIRRAETAKLPRDVHVTSGERRVEYKPTRLWCIIDVDDTVIAQDFPDREAAFAHLDLLNSREAA